jgi:hypothetical protein
MAGRHWQPARHLLPCRAIHDLKPGGAAVAIADWLV